MCYMRQQARFEEVIAAWGEKKNVVRPEYGQNEKQKQAHASFRSQLVTVEKFSIRVSR